MRRIIIDICVATVMVVGVTWLLAASVKGEMVNIAGIYSHVYKVNGKTSFRGGFSEEEHAQIPGIAGTQVSFTWNDLNPGDGVYDWARWDRVLDLYQRNGKRIWVEISNTNHGTPGTTSDSQQPMPRWVRDQITTVESLDNGYISPVWWDQEYQGLWAEFLGQVAARYDGHPALAGISTGGYGSRHEPHPRFDGNPQGWSDAGYVNETQYWEQGIKEIWNLYDDTFENTPIFQTLALSESYTDEMLDYIREKGWIGGSNGFSTKIQTAGARENRRELVESGVPGGWFEWGPTGRDGKGTIPVQSMQSMYEGTIMPSDPSLASFLPFAYQAEGAETLEEWYDALLYVEQNIHPLWLNIGGDDGGGEVPEPRSIVLLGIGFGVLMFITRRERLLS